MNILNSVRYNNNNGRALDNGELMRIAPSIFAEQAMSDRSDRYAFIPTYEVVDAMRENGFFPVSAMQSRANREEKKGFTKHLIRFRQHDGFNAIGDLRTEIVLMNSHDGSSSYQLSSGLFRLACLNGMIVSDSEIETVKCRHSGNIIDSVIEGTFSIIDKTDTVLEHVEDMRNINLPVAAQNAFAKAALSLRWDEGAAPIQAEQLNWTRRMADKSNDLFTTMNRVQENIIKGGLRGRNANNGRTTTRAVNSVTENVKLNKAIWQLAEEMKHIMSA
jgi:Domain of unknown function (DUF932)